MFSLKKAFSRIHSPYSDFVEPSAATPSLGLTAELSVITPKTETLRQGVTIRCVVFLPLYFLRCNNNKHIPIGFLSSSVLGRLTNNTLYGFIACDRRICICQYIQMQRRMPFVVYILDRVVGHKSLRY